MRRVALAAVGAAFTLMACATPQAAYEIPAEPNPAGQMSPGEQQDAVLELAESIQQDRAAQQQEIEVVEYVLDEETLAREEAFSESVDRGESAGQVRENTESFTVLPRQEYFQGGAVVYNYVPNNLYKLFVAPFRVTSITLEQGEELTTPPVLGDTVNFEVVTSQSFTEQGRPLVHILIKPFYARQATNLTLFTNQRVYQFDVESRDITYMPVVSFRYPLSRQEQMIRAAEIERNAIVLNGSIEQFDFGYEIVYTEPHLPRWAPSIVFSDGARTYMQFPSAYRASYAPVLFAVEGNERQLVTYRVVGDYFIADRVQEPGGRFELILDVNAGQIITIIRRN